MTRGHRLRTVVLYKRLQVDAVKQLHRVIKHSCRCAFLIVDCDGIGIIKLAGDLYLAFQSLRSQYSANLWAFPVPQAEVAILGVPARMISSSVSRVNWSPLYSAHSERHLRFPMLRA